MFYIRFFLFKNEQIAHSLFYGEGCEWIAQRKGAIVSESLRSLTKNERMSESIIFLSESLFRPFLHKKWAIRSEIKWANSQPWYLAGPDENIRFLQCNYEKPCPWFCQNLRHNFIRIKQTEGEDRSLLVLRHTQNKFKKGIFEILALFSFHILIC